jgi:hypothetical protein
MKVTFNQHFTACVPAFCHYGHVLKLSIALFILGFGVTANVALADSATPTVQPTAGDSSPQTSPTTLAVRADKLIVLPKFEVNGLRERIETRDKTRARKGWGASMCIENGNVIDVLVFLGEYSAKHPTEQTRLVVWQTQGIASNPYHYGIGDIAASRHLNALGVYTSGGKVWGHYPRCDDCILTDIHPSEINTISDKSLQAASGELRVQYQQAGVPKIPEGIAGDDPNLQVYYAEARLRAIGATAFVVPATERTGPKCDLMLIFAVGTKFFAYRPTYGVYQLKKDALTQLGIKLVVETTAK